MILSIPFGQLLSLFPVCRISAMEPETEHMLRTLKMIMRILGYTNRDVERKLGLSSSYLSRLFSGGMELRFDHIVHIGKAMGLTPEEVLQFAYPHPKEPTEAMGRLLTSTGALPPKPAQAPPAPPAAAGPTEQDLERLMARTLRRFFGEMAKIGEG
jgi:transcriptional regulator with XRE-family HTH domain